MKSYDYTKNAGSRQSSRERSKDGVVRRSGSRQSSAQKMKQAIEDIGHKLATRFLK